ncbi:hypothetical protein [Streptomyces sp. NPDC093111]|uniref:hypothetical protein n=1 Tax=Streptomyces sp. NPDC093111 TaxID=3154978 RepID=UPI003414F2BF
MLITDAAVHEAALTLAQRLTLTDPATGTWTIDPEAPADGAAHLTHDDGRSLSFRPIYGGTTAQIWITGAPTPSLPADATPAERNAHKAHLALRLAAGHRYNHAITLLAEDDNDDDPADLIQAAVENNLLPAFTIKPLYVGHRPWDDLFAEALAEATNENATPTGTSLRDCGPEAHTQPAAETSNEPGEGDPVPEVEADAADTSETSMAQSDEGLTVGSDMQQPTEATPAAEPQEPEADEAVTDGVSTGDALRSAAKRRPRKRTSNKKPD